MAKDSVGKKTKTPVDKVHKRFLIIASLFILLGVGGFISYDTYVVNKRTQALLVAPGILNDSDATNDEKMDEGADTTTVTTEDFSNYIVAGDAPRLLSISKLGLTARIKPMGVNSDNSIQAPKNINDAGWYTGSAKPGAAGVMFIDGHASGASRQGLFAFIDTLDVGDEIGVEKGNGEQLTYVVKKVETIPLTAIDMSTILSPYSGVKDGLNLMTCTGAWIKGSDTMDHRVVVYTELI